MRFSAIAIRYAKWARLIDQNGNVSRVHFCQKSDSLLQDDAQKDYLTSRPQNDLYDSTVLMKVLPAHAYPNRTMTEKDLHAEKMMKSATWEDFRTQTVGDRSEEAIGSLHVEVLACHGLVCLSLCLYEHQQLWCHISLTQNCHLAYCSLVWTHFR